MRQGVKNAVTSGIRYLNKQRFVRFFKSRFFLRFHMSLILSATIASGILASKLFLMMGLTNMVIRYPLVVIVSYAIFFLFMKIWLWYITRIVSGQSDTGISDVIDGSGIDLPDLSSGPSGGVPDDIGGGGLSGGGGASRSFAIMSSNESTMPASGSSSGGGSVFDALDLGDDWGVAIIVIGLIVLAICGAAIYLVYSAPAILADAAFQFVLASTLARKSRQMDTSEWTGSVFRATWIPFAIVMVITLTAALVARHYFPGVTKMSELLSIIKAGNTTSP